MGVKEASAKCQITGEVEPGGDGVPVGFKRSEVGTIPQDWNEISLISLAGGSKDRFDDGDWIEAEYLTDGGIRLIQTGNIGIGRFIDKEARKYISNQSFEKLRCKDVFEGDLLVCRLAEPAGRACIVPRLDEARAITAVDVTIFRPVPEVAENRFLLHYFGTNQWLSAVNERCGGSTRSRIARGNLGRMLVPLPSDRAEQKAVADALSDADALIESLQQLIAKKRALKQGVMQVLLTGKQRLPGFSCKWVEVSLGDIAEVVMGQSPSSSHYNMKGVGLPLIQGNADVHGRTTIKRVFTDQITKLGRAGDVLM
jgi:type I restriction enzyme S subunit